uniref:uncharacterized protein LOC120346545 n=1 Tax=Styela clava TaxID=7725 RepID=UPI00193A8186|nr:uncharacterized protein LOC120346545 [Styela clava]
MGLRPLIAQFNASALASDNGDVGHQKKCFGMEYPQHCVKYYGPHPTSCLKTIWSHFECLELGTKYPDKLTTEEHQRYDKQTLREVISDFENTRNKADSASKQHQQYCFGMEYPLHCTLYYGPHPVECLVTIWILELCLPDGHKHPTKLSNDALERHDQMNQREIISEFKSIKSSADEGDHDNQNFCFGMAYPKHCNEYYGPYIIDCLKTIWEMVRCLPDGSKFPSKLDSAEIDGFNGMGLTPLIELFNTSALSADKGDVKFQQECFGLEYPEGCVNYYGPHPMECLITIWKSFECLELGSRFPEKLPRSELQRIDNLNIREVTAEFKVIRNDADNNNKESQVYCFGMEYPLHCLKYYGPHPVNCLETMWISARCINEGKKHPTKLSQTDLTRLDGNNLREIINEFNGTKSSADNGDVENQNFCFGLPYPAHCDKYYGPYSVECLTTIWTSVRCLPEGEEYPHKLSESAIAAFTEMGLRPLIAQFNASALASDNGNVGHQKKCFGMEYPKHCVKYYGPHPTSCLKTIWSHFECLELGTKYPDKLTTEEHQRYDKQTLREVISDFENTRNKADSASKQHQQYCFGMEYPLHCTLYYGPHPVECLVTIWILELCLPDGHKHPTKLSNDALERHDQMNQREIISEFKSIKSSADEGDHDNQNFCFGMGQ